MGRHGSGRTHPSRARTLGTIIALVLLILGAVALGVWWWTLREGSDPIDADPVSAFGLVVSSAPCNNPAAGHRTVVTLVDVQPPIQVSVDACGYRQGQRLAVEYLAGRPDVARLAGTTVGVQQSGVRSWLPFGILAAGVLAIGATIMLFRDRREHGRRRAGEASGHVTVADLQAAAAQAASSAPTVGAPTPSPAGNDRSAGPGDAAGQTGEAAPQSLLDSGSESADPPAPTDPGLGGIPRYPDVPPGLRDHAGDRPLLTHGGREEPDRL